MGRSSITPYNPGPGFHGTYLMNEPTLPYLTGDIPGIGGRFRVTAEDFQVEDNPAVRFPIAEVEPKVIRAPTKSDTPLKNSLSAPGRRGKMSIKTTTMATVRTIL